MKEAGTPVAEDLSVRDFYRRVWAEYADPRHHPITAAALAVQARVVQRWVRDRQPGRVLDLGCGPAPVLPPRTTSLVVCADLVWEMLRPLRAAAGYPAVCLDARRLPFRRQSFDLVWCGLLVDHIQGVRGWIEELLGVLSPGGTLGLACWDRSRLPRERYPEDSRMRYHPSSGGELRVASYPNWPESLEILKAHDPQMTLEAFPIVPDSYVLQIVFTGKAAAAESGADP